tara:strand:- start:401 stop:661 length:261 start_codon:yes stop_codon:yes gene_type:complete
MNERDRILIELKMLDAGIVPNTNTFKNVDDQLSLMDDADAQKAKRKWRKLKRKAVKRMNWHPKKAQKFRFREKQAVLEMLATDRNT